MLSSSQNANAILEFDGCLATCTLSMGPVPFSFIGEGARTLKTLRDRHLMLLAFCTKSFTIFQYKLQYLHFARTNRFDFPFKLTWKLAIYSCVPGYRTSLLSYLPCFLFASFSSRLTRRAVGSSYSRTHLWAIKSNDLLKPLVFKKYIDHAHR